MTAITPVAETPAPLAPRRTSLGVPIPKPVRAGRLGMVDAVRGLAIVVMALDHVRAYLTAAHFDPTDLAQAGPALFLTRWITHFCAPAFVLLAGVGAWLGGRRRTRAELSRFLVTRGLWLILLEFTVISAGWYFNVRYELGGIAQVIWAIGASMVVLAALVHLPMGWITGIGIAMVAGHNLLDGIAAADAGRLALPWSLLHVAGPLDGAPFFIVYPILPWIGVMALGYALGPLLGQGDSAARLRLRVAGAALVAGFVLLRAANGYGDPAPWSPQESGVTTALSFLKTTKYPPSLLYLLMTLGPTLLLLSLPFPARNRVAGWLRTLGRAPLFFYVTHIYLIHTLAITLGVWQGFAAGELATLYLRFPEGYGLPLAGVYAAWAVVVVALYPATRWFAEVKDRGRGWWWSYL